MKKIISLMLAILMLMPFATSVVFAEGEEALSYIYVNVLVDKPAANTKIYNTPVKIMASTSKELPYVEFTDRTGEINIDITWYSWLYGEELGDGKYDEQFGNMFCTQLNENALVKNGLKYCFRIDLTAKNDEAYFDFRNGALLVNGIYITDYENYGYDFDGEGGPCAWLYVPAGVEKEAASGGLLGTDYFKNGIEKGVLSYATLDVEYGWGGWDTWGEIYYDVPENIHNYIIEYNNMWDEGTFGDYLAGLGLEDAEVKVQIDMSLDGTRWLSDDLTWNTDHTRYYGNLSYSISSNEKMQVRRPIWLDDDSDYLYSFLKPAMIREFNEDYEMYQYYFDKDNRSIYIRLRYGIYQKHESGKVEYVYGDWSNVAIVGKNSNQPVLVRPEKTDAPAIGDVTVKTEQGDRTIIRFNHIVPQSVNDADLYYSIFGGGDVGGIAGQIKINSGEWQDLAVINGGWHSEGYREMWVYPQDIDIQESDDITIRVRYEGNPYYSDWSNEVTVKGKHTYIFTTELGWHGYANGEDGTFTWAFNDVPDRAVLQHRNDDWEWEDVADVTSVNTYTVKYREAFKDSSQYYRVVATFGDVQIESDGYLQWDHKIEWTKWPESAKLQNGTDHIVEWALTDEPDSTTLYAYNEDTEAWDDIGPVTSPLTISAYSDITKTYRISVYFAAKGETLTTDFQVTWGNFSFEEQPQSDSAQIGIEIGVSWRTSFVPEKTELFGKDASGEWILCGELDEYDRTRSYHVFPNDAEPVSETYKIRVWNKGVSYDSNEFTLTWTYKKGDFDNDKKITVADALAALRIAAKLTSSTKAFVVIGDCDGDKSVTVADALAILRVAAKLAKEESLGL